jgi:hypothetical protein
MTYETFKRLIDLKIAHQKKISTLYDLKIDMIEAFEEIEKIEEIFWEEVLTEEGYDWLLWYLYEKNGISGNPKQSMQAWDSDGEEICQDLKALYSFLEKSNYIKTIE